MMKMHAAITRLHESMIQNEPDTLENGILNRDEDEDAILDALEILPSISEKIEVFVCQSCK